MKSAYITRACTRGHTTTEDTRDNWWNSQDIVFLRRGRLRCDCASQRGSSAAGRSAGTSPTPPPTQTPAACRASGRKSATRGERVACRHARARPAHTCAPLYLARVLSRAPFTPGFGTRICKRARGGGGREGVARTPSKRSAFTSSWSTILASVLPKGVRSASGRESTIRS